MYAAHLLLRSRRLAPRRIRSVYPSEPAPRPIRIDLRVWLGVGHLDTHHTRSRASGTRRSDSDGIRLRSVRTSSRRIGSHPSHPWSILQRTGKRPLPERRRSNRDGGQTADACRRDDEAGRPVRYSSHCTPCKRQRAIPNSPNHHTTHVMGTYAPGELRRHLALELDRPVELTADA